MLLIGMEFDVPGLVGWLPEGLSNPINCTRREHRVKPSPYPPEWNSYLLRDGRKPMELDPNQCLKPLSHTSKLLIGMEFDVPGLVGWLPEGLSDPINYVSRSALARVLFRGLYPDLRISPASKRDSIKICLSLGDAIFSMNTPPLNDDLCQFLPPTRPGENTRSSQALTRLNGIHISYVKGESPWNWTVTLLLHYGEVHSRHGRSTSYRSARRTRLA
nr:hypothetical protein GlmaxMp02, mitochondrial [Tanacetum cinerariifolium]